MKDSKWLAKIQDISILLDGTLFTDIHGQNIEADTAFQQWTDTAIQVRFISGTIYLIGNGASASMASHFAADLAKNARLHTEVFSDLSLITAISNDIGYEYVFSEPLKRRGKQSDMLIAISSSGESKNILMAVKEAKILGIKCVTLSAMNRNNSLRRLGDINIYVSANSYGLAETCHAAILHHWMDMICQIIDQGQDNTVQ